MKAKILFAITCLSFIFCCSTSTYITGSWKNPKEKGKYGNIMIAALTSNTILKSSLEDKLSKALEKEVQVSKSIDEFPPTASNNDSTKAGIMKKMKNRKSDAVLTVSILKKETETRYLRERTPYEPYGYLYYNDFWGYYDYRYPIVYSEGYYVQDNIYFIETNLYDTDTKKLIWSAQTKTYSPDNFEPFAKEFARIITSKLKSDNVLQPPKPNSK